MCQEEQKSVEKMQQMPKVSIIVPVYNAEKYLMKCVDSILVQSYDNIEVILVDDGSVDGSPKMCDEYAKKDNRVQVIHKKNAGLVSARCDGLKVADGEYVQFVDSDDWVSHNMTEKMMDVMMQYGAECVICGFYNAGEKLSAQQPFFKEGFYSAENYKKNILSKMLQTGNKFQFGIAPSVWGKLFIRSKVMSYVFAVPKTISFGEDTAITYPYLLNECKSVYIMGQCLYYYRYNPASMTKSYNKRQTEETIILLNYLQETANKSGSVEFKRQLDYYTMFVAIVNFSNEKKGGFGKFLKRYNSLIEFMKALHVNECIKRSGKKILDKRSRLELKLMQNRGGLVFFAAMITIYNIQHLWYKYKDICF